MNLATRQMIAAEDDGWNGRPRTDVGELRVACVGLRVSADGPGATAAPSSRPRTVDLLQLLVPCPRPLRALGLREVEIRSCRADFVRWDLLCERQAESAIRLGQS